ncbi:DUF2878 domain-containing protein, partial [Leucothrix sargassi]
AALLREHAFWVMVPLLVLHFYFTPSRREDLKLLLFLMPLGMAVEAILLSTDLVRYESDWALPIWMVLLWMHLIVSCNHSLQWLQKTPFPIVAVLSGVAGASSYAAASNLGAMIVASPRLTNLAIIGGLWAVLFVIMSRVAKYNKQRVSA